MKFIVNIGSLVALAAAAADPQITARAVEPRQNIDPAFLGYVSASKTFSDARSCDYPQTLSRSGSLAQCCSGNSCNFWSSCSGNTLFASQTSQFCDLGLCNTAIIVPTIGATSGQNYLGCWASSLGTNAFTIIADIGSAPVGMMTGSVPASSGASTARPTSGASSAARTPASSAGSATQSATSAAQSSNAANVATVQPYTYTGVFGLVALVFSML